MLLPQFVLDFGPCLVTDELIADKKDPGISASRRDGLVNVGNGLVFPFLLRTESKSPSFRSCLYTCPDIPPQRDFVGLRVSLTIDLAISSARRASLREKVRAHLSLGQVPCEGGERNLLAPVRQSA